LAAIAALVRQRTAPPAPTIAARLLAAATALALVGLDWPLAALALCFAVADGSPHGSGAHRRDVALCVVALGLVVADVAVARVGLENVPKIVASMLAVVAALALAVRAGWRVALAAGGVLAIGAFALAIDRVDVTMRATLVAGAILVVSVALLAWFARASPARLAFAFAALLVTVTVIDGARARSWRLHADETERQDRQDVARLGAWAATALPPGAVLTPLQLDPDFQWQSRHPSWVSWRSGAAVMWSPSFYPTWSTRMHEVTALRDPAARVAYACDKGIPYVLEEGTTPPDTATVLRREGRYALLAPRCPPR
jgi:hypothetical protein